MNGDPRNTDRQLNRPFLESVYLRHRLVLWILVVTLSSLAAFGFSRMSFDNEARGIFRTRDAEFDELEEVFSQFRPDENDCMVFIEAGPDGFFTPDAIASMRQLHEQMAAKKLVTRVISLLSPEMVVCTPLPHPLIPKRSSTEVNWKAIELQAHAHPIVERHLLTADGRRALMIIQLGREDLLVSDYELVVDEMFAAIAKWNRESPHRAYLTGLPPLRAEIFRSIRTESLRLMIAGALVATVVSLTIFRNWPLALMTFAGATLGSFWSLGFLSLFGVKINLLTTILPVLVIVIGLTDSVHLVFDIRDSRMRGIKPLRSSWLAVRRLGVACAFTSITTAIGFGSLSASGVSVIQNFGITCAAGTLMTFLAVILIVPLLAGSKWVGGRYHGKLPRESVMVRQIGEWYAGHVLRYRYVVILFFAGLIMFLGWTVAQLYPDSHIHESLPRNGRAKIALDKVDEHFGGILSVIVVVKWDEGFQATGDPLQVIRKVTDEIDQDPDLFNPMSINDFYDLMKTCTLFKLPTSIEKEWFRPDLKRAIVVARIPDRGVHYHQKLLKRFRGRMHAITSDGVELKVSGSAVVAGRNLAQMISDLVKSLAIAAVVIFVVLTIMFRSLRLGAISVIPNAVPLLFTAAFLVWIGEPLRLTSVLLFTVSLGIAVDDTIHFLVRFRRECGHGLSVDQAIRNTIVSVGGALIVSTLVLLAGFSASMISVMPHSRLFSKLASIAVVVALCCDLLLLPALLSVCYRKETADT